MRSKPLNLKTLVRPYAKGQQWVALSRDQRRVVGSGKTIREALAQARRQRVARPVLIQALRDYSGFVPSLR